MGNESSSIKAQIDLVANDKGVVDALKKIEKSVNSVGNQNSFKGLQSGLGSLSSRLDNVVVKLDEIKSAFMGIKTVADFKVETDKISFAIEHLEQVKKSIEDANNNKKNSTTGNTTSIERQYDNLLKKMSLFKQITKNGEMFKFDFQNNNFDRLYESIKNSTDKSEKEIISLTAQFENLKNEVSSTFKTIQGVQDLNLKANSNIINSKKTLNDMGIKDFNLTLSDEYRKVQEKISQLQSHISKNSEITNSKNVNEIFEYISKLKQLEEELATATQSAKNLTANLSLNQAQDKYFESVRNIYTELQNLKNNNSKIFEIPHIDEQFKKIETAISDTSVKSKNSIKTIEQEFNNLKKTINGINNSIKTIGKLNVRSNMSTISAQNLLDDFSVYNSNFRYSNEYKNLQQSILKLNNFKNSNSNIETSKNPTQIQSYIEQIQKLENELNDAYVATEKLFNQLKLSDGVNSLTQKLLNLKQSFSGINENSDFANRYNQIFKSLSNSSEITQEKFKSLNQSYNSLLADINSKASSISGVNKEFENLDKKVVKLEADLLKFKSTKIVDENTISQIQQFINSYNSFKSNNSKEGKLNLTLGSTGEDISKKIQQIQELTSSYTTLTQVIYQNRVESSISPADAKLDAKYKELAFQLENLLKMNGKMTSDKAVMSEFSRIMNELTSSTGRSADAFQRLRGSVANLKTTVYQKGLTGRSLSEELSYIFEKIGVKAMLGTVTYRSIGIFKQMIENVKELDTAMTTLKRVTNETQETYSNLFESAKKDALETGVAITDLINSTSDFSRAGFSNIDDAYLLAKNASIYSNVGFLEIDSATEHLTSVLNAFNITAQDSIEVIDKFDKIGNEFSITSADIGEALERSGSALLTANNTIDEAIALITAGNTIVQDPESVANGVRTIALRLRGAKAELEKTGEDVEGMATSTAKLQKKILGLSGIDILQDNGDFKSTYENLKELSKVYDTLDDKSQAALLETIAGKNRANVAAAILSRFDIAEQSYEASLNSSGTATKEMEVLAESTNYKLKQLEATYQNLSSAMINSDGIKFLIDGFRGILNIVTNISEVLGSIPSIVGAISIGIGALKSDLGFFKLIEAKDGDSGIFGTGKTFSRWNPFQTTEKNISALENYINALKANPSGDIDSLFSENLRDASRYTREIAQNITDSVGNIEDVNERARLLDNSFASASEQIRTMTIRARVLNGVLEISKTVANTLLNVAVSFVAVKIVEGISNEINKTENEIISLKENIESLQNSISDNENTISNLQTKLEENYTKIREINSNPLTITSQTDLENLERQNVELKNQLSIIEDINKAKKKELEGKAVELLNEPSEKSLDGGLKKVDIFTSIDEYKNRIQEIKAENNSILKNGINAGTNETYERNLDLIDELNSKLAENISLILEQKENLSEESEMYNRIVKTSERYEGFKQDTLNTDYLDNIVRTLNEFEKTYSNERIFKDDRFDYDINRNFFEQSNYEIPDFISELLAENDELSKALYDFVNAPNIKNQSVYGNRLNDLLNEIYQSEDFSSNPDSDKLMNLMYWFDEQKSIIDNINNGYKDLSQDELDVLSQYQEYANKLQAAYLLEEMVSKSNTSPEQMSEESFNSFKNSFLEAAEKSNIDNLLASVIFTERFYRASEESIDKSFDNFNIGDYEDDIDNVQKKMETLRKALSSLINNDITKDVANTDLMDLFQNFPSLTIYANDAEKLKEEIVSLMQSTPSNLISTLEDLKKTITNEDIPAVDNLIESLKSISFETQFNSYKDTIDNVQNNMSTLRSALSSFVSGDVSDSDLIDLIQEFPSLAPYVNDTKKLKEEIVSLMNETPSDLITQLESLKDTIDEQDVPAVDSLIDRLKRIRLETHIDGLTEDINTAESELQKLNNYIETNDSNDDYFDNSSLYEMLQLYPELTDKILQTSQGYKVEKGALEEVKRARLETLKSGLQAELDNAKAVIENSKQKLASYGIELQGIDLVNEAKLKQAELEKQILLLQNEIASNSNKTSIKELAKTKQQISALEDFIGANESLSDTGDKLNSLQLQINQLGTKFVDVDDEIDKINDDLDDAKDKINDQIDALKDMVDALEDELDNVNDASDKIKDLIDLTVAMIKKQKELEKEALQDELDRINKIIDARKEQLKIEKEEYEYQKGLDEKTSDVNSIQSQLETLAGDDSEEAMKKRLELQNQLKDKQDELDDYQFDHKIELEEKALETEEEYYKEFYDEKIKAIDDYLSKEGIIRQDAINLINGKTQEFYDNLVWYTQTYTDMARFEFDQLWNDAYAMLEKYGNGQIDVLATLQYLSVQANYIQAQIDAYNATIENLNNNIKILEQQAKAATEALQAMADAKNALANTQSVSYSQVDYSSPNNSNESLKSQLDSAQKKLERLKIELQDLYNQSNYNPNFENGQMKIDKKKKEIAAQEELVDRLKRNIQTYHVGGLVKAKYSDIPTSLKSNEVFAKLMSGEVVVTEKQANDFMTKTLPKLSSSYTPSALNSNSNVVINIGDTVIQGNADDSVIAQIKDLQKQWSNDIFKSINKSVRNTGGGRNFKNII